MLFLPYMAVVDGFQHWVYTEAPADVTPADLDRAWAALWDRFMPGIDYGDLATEKETGWQRKGHIFEAPFYYIEYGLAQLGALQVWRNALADQAQAVADYRARPGVGLHQVPARAVRRGRRPLRLRPRDRGRADGVGGGKVSCPGGLTVVALALVA